jgi:tripartite-type tricarboxylate transporter receptor subunit TctC
VAAIIAISLGFSHLPVAADEPYPTRPIRMLIPAPPGGGLDTVARQLAEGAQRLAGMQFIVENKTGASGTIVIRDIMTARPDGYTIAFMTNSTLTVVPHVMPVTYTPDSYLPLLRVNTTDYALCVAPSFPANNGREFIAELVRNPGRYSYGVDGAGGILHVTAEHAFRQLGVRATAVPFAGGQVTLTNFLGGHIAIFGGGLPSILSYLASGQAKCLMLTSADDNARVPQAAGLRRLGVNDLNGQLWFGAIAPRDTPAPVAERLIAALTQAARDPGMAEVLARIGGDLAILGPEEFRQLIQSESDAFRRVIPALDLKP